MLKAPATVSEEDLMNTRTSLLGLISALAVLTACTGCVAAGPKPVGQWVFTPEHTRGSGLVVLTGGPAAKITRRVRVIDAGETQALQFDGGANAVQVADPAFLPKLPKSRFTAETWVRIDGFRRWSRFVGVFARQENRRKGWFIGTHYHRFVFSLGAERGMTDLHSGGSAHAGQWVHVAGTYDGERMRLFVNGLLAGESTAQTGEVKLPTGTPLSMGDYHNGAEFYPLRGALHEVRVYDQALSEKQIRRHYLAKARLLAAAPPLVMSGCFGDNMVLQRERPLPVWGRTLPGDDVTVACAAKTASAKADGDGRWRLTLPKLDAGGPHEFTVTTPRGRLLLRNVVVGDVWFCAGQSNLALG